MKLKMIDWRSIVYWSSHNWIDGTFNDWVSVSHFHGREGWSWNCTGGEWLAGVHEFTI